MTNPSRPPVPPFDEASARQKVLAAEGHIQHQPAERALVVEPELGLPALRQVPDPGHPGAGQAGVLGPVDLDLVGVLAAADPIADQRLSAAGLGLHGGLVGIGPRVAGAAVAMDKAMAKTVLDAEGIPQPAWRTVRRRAISA